MAERPLSPHLSVYRWQLTMLMSITHRATGGVLSLGAIVVIWWLYAVSVGGDSFATVQSFLGSWLGILLLMGMAFSVFFHLLNGIRHLIWDTGRALEIGQAYTTGWIVVGLSALATLASWYLLLGGAS